MPQAQRKSPRHEPGEPRGEAAVDAGCSPHGSERSCRFCASARRGTRCTRCPAARRSAQRAAGGGHGDAEEPAGAGLAEAAAEAPHPAGPHLDAEGLHARAGPYLAPEHQLAAAPARLGERQREGERRELRAARVLEEAALEATRLRLVLDEIVDEHVDARRLVRPQAGLADQLGLPLLADAVATGLVAVLGQPDPLRPERAA